MEQLVITVLGNDRSGLVDAVAGAVNRYGGNWEQSHLAELAGKFAGVILVRVPSASSRALRAELDGIEAKGLLTISVETVDSAADEQATTTHRYKVEIMGQDHPGIVYELSHILARHHVSIDEFRSEVAPAPMGGELFHAVAVVDTPESMAENQLQDLLEGVASDLMVDLQFQPATSATD